jgi:SAM-dependent methyltransferase
MCRMTRFEICYSLARPLLPPLYGGVRKIAAREIHQLGRKANLLDVGGRKSHYTIGLNANVTISEVPRTSPVQKTLNLGTTDEINLQTVRRRSNVSRIVYDDMTASALPDGAYDIVLAVEVLEHVQEDFRFLQEVHRVLAPGGVFVMTTPNGDFVVNTNPDHKRHYHRIDLVQLLERNYSEVKVWYGIPGGLFRGLGLKSWSWHKPVQTVLSMLGNLVNTWQSRPHRLSERAAGTRHLFAIARKNGG